MASLSAALVLSALLFSLGNVSQAQPPSYWGLPPVNVVPAPIVNEFDGQATFDGEWNQANWDPDLSPYQGTYYGEIIADWRATASNPANQTTYPGLTMLQMHDLSDLTVQELWDYNTFQITINGDRVTGWVFGNDNHPDNLDYQWIGGSGIGYSSIDDRGFLVRLNDDPTTDRHWFPGDLEPGDPNFDWDAWYGFFGSYGFNNTAWQMGLPHSINGPNEVYELACRGYNRTGSPLAQINACYIVQNIVCDVGAVEMINGTHVISCGHALPLEPMFPGVDLATVFVPNSNVAYNSGAQLVQAMLVNEHDSTETGTAQISSRLGLNVTPSSIPYTLQPGQTLTVPVTIDVPPSPALINSIDTLTITSSDYSSYNTLRITDAPSQLNLSVEELTVNAGTFLPIGCTVSDPQGKQVKANPVWELTGGLGTISAVMEPHVPACVAFARANFTNAGTGWIIVTQGNLRDSAQVTVVAPPLDVTLIPVNPPIIVPAQGGNFSFNASVVRTVGPAAPFWVWARIKNPNGTYTTPTLGPVQINPPPGVIVSRLRNQSIPGAWAPGLYTYLGYANTSFSYPAIDSSSFPFTKSTVAGNGPEVFDAFCSGELFPGEVLNSNAVASVFDVCLATPNPFNPVATIHFNLPEATRVTLNVYDVSGRLVAQLINGLTGAGSHQATFDGSHLASGVYLYRLTAGSKSATGKMVLMK
jgi:hypothetical protein